MLGNADIEVYRKSVCSDEYGRKIRGDCEYNIIGQITCARRTPMPLTSAFRKSLEDAFEFDRDHKLEVLRFHWENLEFEIKKDDFVLYYISTIPYYSKVIRTDSRPAVGAVNSVSLIVERLEPRECPKDLIVKSKTDTL